MMNRELIDRCCERGILALVLLILVGGPLAGGAVLTADVAVLAVLTAGVLALWVVRLWTCERPKFLCPPVCWAVLAFVGYAGWRYATCDLEYIGRLELLRVLMYVALFFAIVNNLHRQETTQIIGFSMIYFAMALAILATWQFLTRSHKVPALNAMIQAICFPGRHWYFDRYYMDRGSATYINPNHLAGLLEMLLPVALAYVLAGRGRPVTKVFLGYAAIVIIFGIGLTGSRGSWASTGLSLFGLFVVLASHRSYRLPALGMLALLLAGGIYLVAHNNPFKERLGQSFNAESGKVELDMRAAIWKSTVRMWHDHLWLGVGPGHYDYRFREYRPLEVQLRPDHAHNEYLELLADWGLAGAILVAGFLAVLVLGVRRTWAYVRRSEREFKSNRSDKFAFVAGAAFALVAAAAHAVVDFNLHIPANAILATTLVALLASHVRFATEQHWHGGGLPSRLVVSLLLVAGAVALGQQGGHLLREAYWLGQADSFGPQEASRLKCLERASVIDPRNFETTYQLGHALNLQSQDHIGDEDANARLALQWFSRGTNLNRYYAYNYLESGECLDFLGRTNESHAYFMRADELDPNGYFTSALIGRHYRELGDYAACRVWSERSLHLERTNRDARANLLIANTRLLEQATNNPGLRPQ